MIDIIVDRLKEADVETKRFIRCVDGEKKSVDHTKRTPDEISGNYGIYALAEDDLVLVDVDDYGDLEDDSGLEAINRLADTLEQESPHGGTHRLYRVEGDGHEKVSAILENELGKKNPNPSWGEVRVANQYIVGAGSQLDGCDKDWCEHCATNDGGYYTIKNDRSIATITSGALVRALKRDPVYAESEDEEENETNQQPTLDADESEILDYALNQSNDEKLKRLWNGDYSDYGGDRSEAECALAAKLAFWLQGDKSAVERAMDDASPEKWGEREDSSYRDSVLEAVDTVTEYYTPRPTQDTPTITDDDGGTRTLPTPSEFFVEEGCYGIWKQTEAGEHYFDPFTNFQLEVLSFVESELEDTQINMRVIPVDEPAFEVAVSPTVFNEKRDFKNEICKGLTTTFSGGEQELNLIRRFVGTQGAPVRTGIRSMGLHGDEWVTPHGSLTADGWHDEPEHVYFERNIGAERKWSLTPDQGDDYDRETVKTILELLPKTRDEERFIPALTWFYAAPLRPYILDWEGQFNLLFILGETGAGKTATISTLWDLFGMKGDPFTADDTKFTLMTTLASTNAIPMWFDEYKPSDMDNWAVKSFGNELRKTTRGGVSQRGRPDGSTVEYHLHAPVLVSGEERMNGSAEERRGIFTTFKKDVTEPGTQTAEAFAELAGTSVKHNDGSIEYHDGCDLTQHALAYYRFILGLDKNELEDIWRRSKKHVSELLEGESIELKEDLVEQGVQTMKFGATIYRTFANGMGADADVLDKNAVDNAIVYVASKSIGGANRKSHTDTFFELCARAAHHEYLAEGSEYKFVNAGNADEELRINIATAYDRVAKYCRDHDVADDLLNSKDDYRQRIKDEFEKESYIVNFSQNTPPLGRCVGLHMYQAETKLDDFEKAMFTTVSVDEDELGAVALAALEPGYHTITVRVDRIEQPENDRAPAYTATFSDATGTVDCVDWFGSPFWDDIDEGQCYRMKKAKVGFDKDGAAQVEVIHKVTTATSIQPGVGTTGSPDRADGQTAIAETDGGSEPEGVVATVKEYFANNAKTSFTTAQVAGATSYDPEEVKTAIDTLATKGVIMDIGDGYRLN